MSDLVRHNIGEVEPGLTLDAINTVEAADALLDRLQAGIVRIEQQLGSVRPGSINEPDGWRPRAKAAMRAKGFWIPRVQARRAELARQDRATRKAADSQVSRDRATDKRRLMVRLAWEHEPAAMRRVEDIARELRPELFNEALFEEIQ